MAFTFGFYNSKNHDRKYDARQFCSIFDGIITDGVFESIGKQLTVKLKQNRTVLVQEGRAWFNHTWNDNDTAYELTIDAPDALYTRWDAVILEVNSDDMVRTNILKVIKGTPASNPNKPELKKTTSLFQYPLAYVQVIPGKTTLEGSDIHNVVGSPECPFVKPVTKIATLSDIYSQYEEQYKESLSKKTTEFENWFQSIQSNLSGDQATKIWAYIMLTPSLKTELEKIGRVNSNTNIVDALGIIISSIVNQKIVSNNITISSTSIENADTFDGVKSYKYMIRVPFTGCSESHIPHVYFKDRLFFSDVCVSHNGYVNIFTNDKNFGSGVISKIVLERGE